MDDGELSAQEPGIVGSILLVEDSLEYIEGLARYFRGIYGIRSATTVAEAIKILAAPEPAAQADRLVGAIIDIRLLDGSGIDVLAAIRARGLSIPVLIVTAFFVAEHAAAAQLHGAEFLPKGVEEPKHLEAFSRRVREHAGEAHARGRTLVDRFAKSHRLTQRETEILALAMSDVPRVEMAKKLGISPDTLKSHVRGLLRKSRVRTLAELGSLLRRMRRGDVPEDGT